MPKIGKIVNKRGISEIFGVSVQAIDGWITRGCPYVEKGAPLVGYKFDTAAVAEWRAEQAAAEVLGDIARVDETEARRRKIAAEAALAEHELAVKQGSAVSVSDAVRGWGALVSAFRARLLGTGNKLGPLVSNEDDPLECQAIIDGSIHEALAELSNFDTGEISELPGRIDGSPERPAKRGATRRAAAKAHGKRVGGRKPKVKRRVKP